MKNTKRGTYNSTDIESFKRVIEIYDNGYKPTYKLACISKCVGFKKFRKYMLDMYEFDPDDVDIAKSVKALNKGMFYKMFVNTENMYASRSYVDIYINFYKTARDNKFDLKDRFLYNKVNKVKAFDKSIIQRLKERYSLIPAERI